MNELVFLTREALLEEKDALAIQKVELSRGFVFVREMTASEKSIWERSLMKEVPILGAKRGQPTSEFKTTLEDYRAKLAVCTVCDEFGKLLFTMRDVKLLSTQLSASNMELIADAASHLNKITQEDQEEMVKNSEAVPEEDSNSDSAAN